MNFLALLVHLCNFLLPALAVGAGVALAGRWVRKGPPATPFVRSLLLHWAAGTLVLLAGLVVFGRDGKMATYAALVVIAATVQWALNRSWRG